jgi:hypothetical protein
MVEKLLLSGIGSEQPIRAVEIHFCCRCSFLENDVVELSLAIEVRVRGVVTYGEELQSR